MLIENSNQGRKGQLAEGFDADLVIWSPDETQLVRCTNISSVNIIIVNSLGSAKWFFYRLVHPILIHKHPVKVEVGDIQHKNKLTPYLGRKLRGVIYRS